MLKIAIIGAGFSGCYLYNRLEKLGHEITIFEKSRGTGGRLSTKYVGNRFCDHGTSTFKTKNPDFISFCNEQVSKGILSKSNDSYIPTLGMNAMCKCLINKDNLKTNTKIVSCVKDTNKWTIEDDNLNTYKNFDLLILTIPATQILLLDLSLKDDGFHYCNDF